MIRPHLRMACFLKSHPLCSTLVASAELVLTFEVWAFLLIPESSFCKNVFGWFLTHEGQHRIVTLGCPSWRSILVATSPCKKCLQAKIVWKQNAPGAFMAHIQSLCPPLEMVAPLQPQIVLSSWVPQPAKTYLRSSIHTWSQAKDLRDKTKENLNQMSKPEISSSGYQGPRHSCRSINLLYVVTSPAGRPAQLTGSWAGLGFPGIKVPSPQSPSPSNIKKATNMWLMWHVCSICTNACIILFIIARERWIKQTRQRQTEKTMKICTGSDGEETKKKKAKINRSKEKTRVQIVASPTSWGKKTKKATCHHFSPKTAWTRRLEHSAPRRQFKRPHSGPKSGRYARSFFYAT